MKIAVVVNSLKIGGMERVAVNLASACHDDGHEVDLIYLKNRRVELKPDNPAIPVSLIDVKKGVLQTGIGILWLIVCRLSNLLMRKTYSLFFAYAEAKVFAKKLAQMEQEAGKPFDLIVFRGHGTFEHVWPLQDPRFVFVCESVQAQEHYGFLSRWAFSHLYGKRKMVCISQGVMDNFQQMVQRYQFVPERTALISNPIEFDRIAEHPMGSRDALHPRPYLLGLGRLNPVKNFPLLIRAYHQLVQSHEVTQDLVLVGDGKERDSLEKLVDELQLRDRVFFQGTQNPPYAWFYHADLFVLSSKSEGLGMVIIEALACGTTIVATRCPGGVSQIMQGELDQYLTDMTPEALAEKMWFGLNSSQSDSYNDCVARSLAQFDGKQIVNSFIREFAENLYN
ncbi:glycosyltransferase [Vibrio fluvialis]|nr:glycosyltransferase [Vibrio fluvialis]